MAQNTMGPIFGNQGIITQGQTGNNTIIQGPIARHLSQPRMDTLKTQILREIPKDKRIDVTAVMGDAEAMEFAQEIYSFMKDNGFNVDPHGISQTVFSGPVKGLNLQKGNNDDFMFVVGANIL